MKYMTFRELGEAVRNNMDKVPHDIDFVIGIPRSGMLPATMIAELLHVPLIDIDSFISGSKPTGGNRLTLVNRKPTNKVLVIDDTTYSGSSMIGAKKKLEGQPYTFIYGVAFLEGDKGKEHVDFYLEDVRKYTKQFPNVIYEWNIFHHYPHIMLRCMYDIDGVLCKEPPDERDTEAYEEYIKNAVPMFTPSTPIGKIVTYRLLKYKDITEKWLEDNGIKYGQLLMFNAQSWDERNKTGVDPAQFKAIVYKADPMSMMFIESDDWQAKKIFNITGKPVLSVAKNFLYGGE